VRRTLDHVGGRSAHVDSASDWLSCCASAGRSSSRTIATHGRWFCLWSTTGMFAPASVIASLERCVDGPSDLDSFHLEVHSRDRCANVRRIVRA
jgi:hypothetical protein